MDSSTRLPSTMEHVLLAHAEDVQYGTDSMNAWEALGKNPLANATLDDATDKSTNKPASVQAQLGAAESADLEEEDLETVIARKPRKQVYTVRKKDNLNEIAERYNIELYDLKRWNHLRSTRIHQGQQLVILKEVAETHTERLADQGTVKARKKAEAVAKTKLYKPRYHRVQAGDTLWNIAQRYDGLTIDRLKKLNHIHNNSLRPGQKLIVG